MRKKWIVKTLLLLTIMFFSFKVDGQEFTKSSIKVGIGFGASTSSNTDGLGFEYSVGYQKDIWNGRLRFNPNFSIGYYSSKYIMDARDQYFNSINIEAKLYYDLIKIGSFSLMFGCGGIINNSKGLKGTGGDPESYIEPPTSEYINDFYFGGYLGGGFRVNPINKRIAINILPLNIRFGNNYFAEFHVNIELDFKF